MQGLAGEKRRNDTPLESKSKLPAFHVKQQTALIDMFHVKPDNDLFTYAEARENLAQQIVS